MNFPLVDWWKVGADLLTVAAAYVLALPVARDRVVRTLYVEDVPGGGVTDADNTGAGAG